MIAGGVPNLLCVKNYCLTARIRESNRAMAAVAVEVVITGVEADRVCLEEAAQSRMIRAVAIVVDAERRHILPSREHEAVAVGAIGPHVSSPIGNLRRAKHI